MQQGKNIILIYRANSIKNAPKVNEDPKDALLKQYEEQIRVLREQLQLGGGGSGIKQLPIGDGDNAYHLENERKNLYDEKQKMEHYLKEKEQLLENNSHEKEKLANRIAELEKELDKKFVK